LDTDVPLNSVARWYPHLPAHFPGRFLEDVAIRTFLEERGHLFCLHHGSTEDVHHRNGVERESSARVILECNELDVVILDDSLPTFGWCRAVPTQLD
jgi:hypothetical protein